MQVFIHEDERRDWIQEDIAAGRSGNAKFVMIKSQEYVAQIIGDKTHADEAKRLLQKYSGASFVGAGRITAAFKPIWDSSTCRAEFGHNEPKENTAEIETQFREELMKLFSKK